MGNFLKRIMRMFPYRADAEVSAPQVRTPRAIVKRDQSTKPIEVQVIRYRFHKHTRKIINYPEWIHQKYYNTMEGANDAVHTFRNYGKDITPDRWEIEHPKIVPTIVIKRYRAVRRPLPLVGRY